MKNTLRNLVIPACLLLASLGVQSVHSVWAQQTLTQIGGWNAYVHLPANYHNNSEKYPTIVFFPGLGEVGTNPAKVIAHGPGAYLTQGWNGNVTVDGTTVEFIIISLQPPTAYPRENTINAQLQTLKSNYRIDPTRLYLTGLSHGGWMSSTFVSGDAYGGPYNYASQIAAVVTVQGVKPDDNQPYPNLFDNYALAGGKYLGFEQVNDGRDTRTVVNRMNATVPNSAFFQSTSFGNGGHCCWSQFYGGQGTTPAKFNIGGVQQNLYEWMARQRLGGAVTPPPTNQAPVANAGSDKIITLPTNSTQLQGSGTDSDGSISSYTWTKVSGPTGGTIASPNSAATQITGLTQGSYVYRLTVKDNKGATATDDVKITVNAAVENIRPEPYAGPDKTVQLPVASASLDGSGTDADGTVVSFLWVKMNGPAGGDISNPNVAVTTIKNLNPGLYTYRLKVTDNLGATALDDVKITVKAAVVSNQSPVAQAGTDQVITAPQSEVTLNGTATDADGSISSYAWTKVSGPAGSAFQNANAASTKLTGLVPGTYELRLTVTDNQSATATDEVKVTVNAAAPTTPTPPTTPPVAGDCNTAAPKKHYLAQTSAPGEIYRPNGSQWKGGDTVVITGTNYTVIEFNNIQGDPCRPIVIMPQTALTTKVFRIKGNSAYLKIWGGNTQYGIKITGSAFAVNMSHHIEADNIEVSGGSIGIYAKQDPIYSDPSTWATSGYVMRNLKFSNFYIHDINGEGMYIGHTSPSGLVVKKPNGEDTTLLPVRLENIEISNNIVERTQWDAIQLSNARGGNKIFGNKIKDFGLLNKSSQQAGIIMGSNTSGEIYSNEVISGTGNGIQAFGYGMIKIYNNYVENAGIDGTATGQHSIYASDYKTQPENNPKQMIHMYNNVVKNPPSRGALMITGYANNSFPSVVENNKFCIPGAGANWQSQYIFLNVSGSTNLNNILSCPDGAAPNKLPILKLEDDKTITLPLNIAGLNAVSATDEDGIVTSYQWKKISGPVSDSILAPTMPRTAASKLVEGQYVYELTVTDNDGGVAKATINITVLPEPAMKIVRVNLHGNNAALPDSKWNNWPLTTATNTSALLYENRTISTITASLDGDVRIVDNGINYAGNSNVVNPGVLRFNAAGTSIRELKLNGLNPNKVYDLEFFGSRASRGNATVFSLQDKKDTIHTDFNVNDFARFENVTVGADGKLSIRISRIGVWTYLAGFVIYERELDENRPLYGEESKTVFGADIVEATNEKVTVYPNPFVGSFNVAMDNKEEGDYRLLLTDIMGRNLISKDISKTSRYQVENVSVAHLPSGTYLLQIISKATGKKTVHKLIKN